MKNRFATLQLSEDIDMLVTKVCAFVYVCVCLCATIIQLSMPAGHLLPA